jgi:chaperone BCS1
VVLEAGVMEDLLVDVGRFITDEDWHISHNVPHRRGYLLHGAPGNGKSSVVAAVASHFSLPLAIVPLARLDSMATTIGEVLSSAPPCSVLVLEDIDAVFSHGVLKRDLSAKPGISAAHQPPQQQQHHQQQRQKEPSGDAPSSEPSPQHVAPTHQLANPPPTSGGGVAMHGSGGAAAGVGAASLSELLNAIDGIGAQAGRLVFMTTNDLGALDEALIRPGRCDRVIELKNADRSMASRLFSSFFHEVEDQQLVADLAPLFGAAVAAAAPAAAAAAAAAPAASAVAGEAARVGAVAPEEIDQGGDGGAGGRIGKPRKACSMATLQGLLVRTRGNPQGALDAALKRDFERR